MSLRYHFVLFLAFIATTVFAQRQQSFEGVITYLVKTEAKQKDNPYNKYYTQKYGDTLTVYYHKSGSERREYSNTGASGLDWEIYNKYSNESYAKYKGIDSIFYSSSADTSTMLLTFFPAERATIFGKQCRSLKTVTVDLNTDKHTVKAFYYSGEEHIAPHSYKGRKQGHQDKFYAMSNSLFLGWELDEKYVRISYEAISIEPKVVDPNIFVFPKGIAKIKK